MEVSSDQLLALARFAFVRMDGAWFMSAAKKFGVEAAWQLDVDAWRQFAYVMGKRIRALMFPEPAWPGDFLSAVDIFMKILDIPGRKVTLEGDVISIVVTECEVQKAIAKAGIADCGIVTVETYTQMARGLFGRDMGVLVRHVKNLNQGADRCEVLITRQEAAS
ncbi:MAG: hypothetical protein EPN93_16670 [Spirochaetes bacterium]|nr:MAG: hypothetical protein EPN93_16670 [Spirochaetota bacterium]